MAFVNDGAKAFCVGRERPAVVAGGLVRAVGYQRGLVGLELAHKIHQVVKGVAFDVEFAARPVAHHGGQFMHIMAPDVPLVRTGVHGDATGTGHEAQLRSAQHTGYTERAGISQQSDLVHIDRQSG